MPEALKSILNSRKKTLIAGAVILVLVFLVGRNLFGAKSSAPQYQTATVTRGPIVVSVSASGVVSTANSAQVTTQASGVVKKIDVKNGENVKTGDVIAEIDFDQVGQQRNSQAYAAYQNAQVTLAAAQANLYTTQSTMLTKWNTYMNTAQNSTYQNSDGSPNSNNRNLPQFMSTNDDWLAAEANYKNQQTAVAQAQTALSNSWLSYQQTAPVISAPISGSVTGLGLQVGSVITAQTNASGGSSSQKIASIITQATPTVTVNLTEIDVPSVKIGDNATLTLDSYPNKTFTGKVISIDTVGVVSSGVTTYPAVIKLDTSESGILTNMSVQANIITDFKDNILTVPVGAVQTQNGQTTVRVLKNGQVQSIPVQTGIASTTDEEITSGLTEGETVVTGVTNPSVGTGTSSSSPFGSFRGVGGGGGGRVLGGRGG